MTKRAYNNKKRLEKSQRTRTAIIEAMIAAMANGEEDVAVAELANACSISLRTVYQHFPDKAARIKAINEWVDDQVGTDQVLVRNFADIPDYIERLVDYVFDNETIVRAQMAPGLSKSVRTYRKQIHARSLRKALRERLADKHEVDNLTALILSTVRAEAIIDMRDIYGLSTARIKSCMRAMIEATLARHTNPGCP